VSALDEAESLHDEQKQLQQKTTASPTAAATAFSPLTRADVREEVEETMARFADEFRGSLDQLLERVMRETLAPVLIESVEKGIRRETSSLSSSVREELCAALKGLAPTSGAEDASVPSAKAITPLNGGIEPKEIEVRKGEEDDTLYSLSALSAQRHGGSGAALYRPPKRRAGTTGSTPSFGQIAQDVRFDTGSMLSSPPMSPCSARGRWPPSPCDDILSDLSLNNTPRSSPTSSPFLGSKQPGGKDWRRSFVEKAKKANRKVEFLHGSQCRETHEVNDVLEEAEQALEEGVHPDLIEDGLGGTYFIKDRAGRSIAVFKPRDEEPLALNNPKVHAGDGSAVFGLKEGVLVGEAAINEYAAYLLDQMTSLHFRAGVSATALVRVADSVFHSVEEKRNSIFRKIKDKVGSFQVFAIHDCTSEDLGPGQFPTELVHRLAALDIRLCNADRHSGNILVRQTNGEVSALIPIDHGYALPGEVSGATFEWLSWPAAKRPFSEELRREILAIDNSSVETTLRKRIPVIRSKCLATLRSCTVLLQAGCEAGLTAYDIGMMMVRPDDYQESELDEKQKQSVLEELVAKAKRQAKDDPVQTSEQLLHELIRARCREAARSNST